MAEDKLVVSPDNEASARQQRLLDAYIAGGNERVSGWLDNLAIRSIVALDRHQRDLGIEGSLCEIGVHRARLLILLHLLSRPDEQTVGFDLFELVSDEVAAAYGVFDRNCLLSTLRSHGCDLERIDLVPCDSTKLRPEDILDRTARRVRIFSVDGGHDAETALNDMYLAAQVLSPAGVVLLDDIFNEQWCGVVEAAARFLLQSDHNLVPFFHAGNKMFFAAGREHADRYRDLMAHDLGDVSTKVEKFFGHPILIAWPTPMSAKARAASLIVGETGLRALRQNKLLSVLRGTLTRSSSPDRPIKRHGKFYS